MSLSTRLTSRLSASTRRISAVSSHLSASPISNSNIRTMASVPKTMKGVVIEKNGGPEVLQYKTDVPVPEVKQNQLLVKNDYIGINFIDT